MFLISYFSKKIATLYQKLVYIFIMESLTESQKNIKSKKWKIEKPKPLNEIKAK